MKTTADNLDKAVMAELDEYAGMLKEDIAAAQKVAAKKAIKELKQTSPGKGGYGSLGGPDDVDGFLHEGLLPINRVPTGAPSMTS